MPSRSKIFRHFSRSADDPNVYEVQLDSRGRLCLGKRFANQHVALRVETSWAAGTQFLRLIVGDGEQEE